MTVSIEQKKRSLIRENCFQMRASETKKHEKSHSKSGFISGGPTWTRTRDQRIMSSLQKIYLNNINRLQASRRGVEANVEAALVHLEKFGGC